MKEHLVDAALFSTRLKEARESRGITPTELARRVGVSMNYINMLEHGKRVPSIAIYVALCNALGVSASYLLGYDNRMEQATREALRALREAQDGVTER